MLRLKGRGRSANIHLKYHNFISLFNHKNFYLANPFYLRNISRSEPNFKCFYIIIIWFLYWKSFQTEYMLQIMLFFSSALHPNTYVCNWCLFLFNKNPPFLNMFAVGIFKGILIEIELISFWNLFILITLFWSCFYFAGKILKLNFIDFRKSSNVINVWRLK